MTSRFASGSPQGSSAAARRRGRWRRTLVAGLTALLLAPLVSCGVTSEPDPSPPAPAPSTARPAEDAAYRPDIHLTPDQNWMNDPQRPFFAGDEWHLYYLYNSDYPDGNGTEWFHATSTDLVTWQNRGVAIPKYQNGLGDIQSGSAVVDAENTAGFGRGAIVALVTQQDQGVQRQSLFWSTDDGYTFTAYEGNPVMDNPGASHWRDPKVVWDDASRQWVMVLAEGEKIGFYTSRNLKEWTYRSGFERDDLGLLECPDLFEMSIDGDPSRTTWVLGTSANGVAYGRTTGYAYWTGHWDGERFAAARVEPQWLDGGSDFYAAVTWEDPRLNPADRMAQRFALGWMNNWSYAGELPTTSWFGGAQSIVRTLRLDAATGGAPVLHSSPIDQLVEIERDVQQARGLTIDSEAGPSVLPQPGSKAFRIQLSLSKASFDADELQVVIGSHGRTVTVGFNAVRQEVFLVRDTDVVAGEMPMLYRDLRAVPAVWSSSGEIEVDIFVDGSTLEVFVEDGAESLSSLIFPGSMDLSISAAGGRATIAELRVADLSP
ncbi:glycoside hydrolase family 32 protein [Microbacterium sp. DT81.1]|uniref:glycoside hydrolase family 32 protein n=1 Tax=Microbacterium sp. DT81.1 TaxID=3393413 RepID=UPI003CFB9CFE